MSSLKSNKCTSAITVLCPIVGLIPILATPLKTGASEIETNLVSLFKATSFFSIAAVTAYTP